MCFLFNGEGKKYYAHHTQNTGCHKPVASRMEWRLCQLSPLDIQALWATSASTCLSRLQRNGTEQGAKGKPSWQEHQGTLDAKQKLIFFTVAAPEKINFDTELPLYKQITILSNNLICAKPTENSLKNQ